jgi:hypothetical protein
MPPGDFSAAEYKREPAAYVRGSQVAVTAVIEGLAGTLWIRANPGGDLGGLPEQQVAFSGGEGEYQGTTPSGLPNTVGISTVSFQWEWSATQTGPYEPLGVSTHKLYRVFATPTLSASDRFVPLFDWSCAWASGGQASSYVFDHIWQAFAVSDLPATRYYDDGFAATDDDRAHFFPLYLHGIQEYLTYNRGRCGQYGQIFVGLCALHGDSVQRAFVIPDPTQPSPQDPWTEFHVHNYGRAGVAAHATADPGQKYFVDHEVNWRTDKSTLYDPSYCVAFNDGGDTGDEALEEYENASIAKYGLTMYGSLVFFDNPSGCQLVFD